LGDDIRGRGQAIAVRDDMLGVKSGCVGEQWLADVTETVCE